MKMSKTISTAMPIAKANGITINGSIKCNRGNYDDCSKREISHIVMHYTGNPSDSAKGNANYFHNSVPETSAHYFVDEDNIYQSVDLCDIAWHAGDYSMNKKSIGIEMCTSGNYKISAKTIENSVALVVELCKLLGISSADVDKYVIRHYDVIGKICPAQMAGENNAEWNAFKKSVKDKLNASTEKMVKPTVRQLSIGMSGNDCVMLKVMLKAKGYISFNPTANKKFGKKTKAAVHAFQKDNGIKQTGTVGINTWKALLRK